MPEYADMSGCCVAIVTQQPTESCPLNAIIFVNCVEVVNIVLLLFDLIYIQFSVSYLLCTLS